MVIGKISGLATTIFVFALGFIFLKQAYATSIGKAGLDVGTGLSGASSGVTSLIDSFISPFLNIGNILGSWFGTISNSERGVTSNRDERPTPSQKVRQSDTSTITWQSGESATVPALSAEAVSYYKKLGVNVS